MAVSRNRRFDEDKGVRYLTADNEFEVEVSRALNKWCVSVVQLSDHSVVTQDFYPERWKALARAQDFVRIVNQRNRRTETEPPDDL